MSKPITTADQREAVNALNRRLEDLSEALERRIETFAALPWYTRTWRAITGDI